MTRERDDLGRQPGDEALLARLREGYAPEPLDAARAAAFDARLLERREGRARRPWARAALVAATAAALAWAALPAGDAPPLEPSAEVRADRVAWEQDVIFGDALDDPFLGEDEDLLPPDYLALAGALDF
jgi:hypothetical protein